MPKSKNPVFYGSVRTVILCAAAVLVLAVLVLLYVNGTKTGGREGAAGNLAPPLNIRNVLLISIDTCRPDYLSCYGYRQPTTPNIDAVAAEACLFENAISPVPITLPGHATMMTGTNPPYHGIHDNGRYQLDPANITLAEMVKPRGFATAAVVGAFVLNRQFALDQGFDTYDDYFDNELAPVDIPERRAEEVSGHAIDWIQRHHRDRFFLFVHYYDPHQSYGPPEPFKSKFAGDDKMRYAGEIAYVDHHIGRLINRLKQLSLYDSTLIIITSDHGEMLGEHDELTHGFFVYQSALKVPLIVKLPGRNAGHRVSELVGLVDLVPTVCSALGIDRPPAVQGVDLLANLVGQASLRRQRRLYCESLTPTKYDAGALMGIVTDRWKYIHTAQAELYDLVADPLESNNLLTTHGDEAKRLHDQLQQYLTDWRRDSSAAQLIMDEQTRQRLESLGYAAGLSVTDDLDLEAARQKDDAKDVLEFHHQHLKLAHLILKREFDEAQQLARQMLQQRPHFVDGYLRLARIAGEQDQLTDAVDYLQQAVALQPENASAHLELGAMLAAINKPDEAESHLAVALSIRPQFDLAHFEMGNLLRSQAKLDEAAEHYRQAIAVKPDFTQAHHQLAQILSAGGKTDQAVEHFRLALLARPDLVEAHNDLALALIKKGQRDQAIDHLREALRLEPEFVAAHVNLAMVLIGKGQIDQAQVHARQALELAPDSAEAHYILGQALIGAADVREALDHFRQALVHRSDFIDPMNNLAWYLATSPDPSVRDPDEALLLAQRAAKLTAQSNFGILDTLGAAYASAGQFDRAIDVISRALELATKTANRRAIEQLEQRLQLYRRGEPYLEPVRPIE